MGSTTRVDWTCDICDAKGITDSPERMPYGWGVLTLKTGWGYGGLEHHYQVCCHCRGVTDDGRALIGHAAWIARLKATMRKAFAKTFRCKTQPPVREDPP